MHWATIDAAEYAVIVQDQTTGETAVQAEKENRPQKMRCEHSTVGQNIERDMERPAKQYENRTACHQPDDPEDHTKDHQAMAGMVQLPHE